ncbi:MAG: porin [Flavobacteriales bacterium]|nr:porin [Flavobacteriales bacterium]MCL4855901.1 porin [Flavobacteriales bacterium]
MKNIIKLTLTVLFFSGELVAQEKNDTLTTTRKSIPASFYFSNGIGMVAPDSIFSMNFRFRTQLRSAYTTVSENDFTASEIEARVRRLRLRMEGFVINSKINYYLQLSFSRGDMDWTDNDNSAINSSPNIVRDAVFIYKPTQKLSIIFGQTKLPGNRQRVVSSGELQFADRSIVNSTFTPDRDFGLQFAYLNNVSKIHYALKGAVSSGEGRNSTVSDGGLAYTGRVELLPFGKFTNKGDYFEGDLEREQKPKVSIAAGYHYNERARRTAGTLGKDLYESRNLSVFISDMLIKYRGFALSAEYINRTTDNAFTTNSLKEQRHVYIGEGKMAQISYLFKNNLEIAARYARISPFASIQKKELQREEMGLGVTKYLKKHRVKLQGHVFYNQSTNLFLDEITTKNWNTTFQIEIGI